MIQSKLRNNPHNIALRSVYALKYKEHLQTNASMFYFDEFIINEYFDKDSGWCKEIEDLQYVPSKFINRSIVVSILLSKNGECKWNLRFGKDTDQQFCKMLNELLKIVENKDMEDKVLIVPPLAYR